MSLMKRNLGRLGIRDRIIFNMLSNRPLRVSELLNLSVGDIDLENKTFTIFRSKNTKTRVLSLPKETWNDWTEYLRDKKNGGDLAQRIFDVTLNMMEVWVKNLS